MSWPPPPPSHDPWPSEPSYEPDADDSDPPFPDTPGFDPVWDVPSGPVEQPAGAAPSGLVVQPNWDVASDSVEQPPVDAPNGPVEQPNWDVPSGPVEQPAADAPRGPVEQPNWDVPSGPVEQPASDSPTGFTASDGDWSGLYDGPPPVVPRPPSHGPSRSAIVIGGVALVVVAATVGLVMLLLPSSDTDDSASMTPTTSTADADAQDRLLGMLPPGYPRGACVPVDPADGALATVACEKNSDPGGPVSATYTVVRDKAALDAVFDRIVKTSKTVTCPGRIQSPGPWRRNATPQQTSGTLFCGLQQNRPTLAWTDDAELRISTVQSGPQGPTFDQLYAWWSSHS